MPDENFCTLPGYSDDSRAARQATASVGLPHRRLDFVEIGRGVAALSVVIFHANASARIANWHFDPWLTVMQHGVDFFFVLSGFVIAYAHWRDIGVADKLGVYTLKRFIRLFPILWLVTAGWFLLRIVTGEDPDFAQFVRSFLPYPSLDPGDPQVIWTLRHELLFYAVFSILILSRRIGYAVLTVWAMLCVLQIGLAAAGRPITGLASFFVSAYSLNFMMGIALCRLHFRREFKPAVWPLAFAMAGVAILLAIEVHFGISRNGLTDYTSVAGTLWVVVLGFAFCGVLHGLLRIETRLRAPRTLILLGATTYALYLVHTPLNAIVMRLVEAVSCEWLEGGGIRLILTVLGVSAGFVLHFWFERPVTDWLKAKLLTARGAGT